MKKICIKRILIIISYALIMLFNFLSAVLAAYNQDVFSCFIRTIPALIFYYLFVSEINHFSNLLYIKNNFENINIFIDEIKRAIKISIALPETANMPSELNTYLKGNEILSFIKILDKQKQVTLFYNNVPQTLSLENALKKIEEFQNGCYDENIK